MLDFQLRSIAEKNREKSNLKAGPFDWCIVTPDATINFFKHNINEDFSQRFTEISNLKIINSKLASDCLQGWYFWHEKPNAVLENSESYNDFRSKNLKKFWNLREMTSRLRPIFLWSNAQPNLASATKDILDKNESFFLTRTRYELIKESLNAAFVSSICTIFLCRSDDVDAEISQNEDVILLNLEKSSDYVGPSGLLERELKKVELFHFDS